MSKCVSSFSLSLSSTLSLSFSLSLSLSLSHFESLCYKKYWSSLWEFIAQLDLSRSSDSLNKFWKNFASLKFLRIDARRSTFIRRLIEWSFAGQLFLVNSIFMPRSMFEKKEKKKKINSDKCRPQNSKYPLSTLVPFVLSEVHDYQTIMLIVFRIQDR